MKIDVSPEVHKALQIQAALNGTTSKALANSILSDAIDSEVWELVRRGKSTSEPKTTKPKAPDARDDKVQMAKRYILAELEAGREPTVQQVADAVGEESRPLGRMLREAGFENVVCRRDGKQARRYTLDMIDIFRRS